MRITFTQGTNSTIDYQANNPANGQVSINCDVTVTNDANVIFHTATNLDSIEIQDGSTATVTLGFSLENIILTSGSLDLTVNRELRRNV